MPHQTNPTTLTAETVLNTLRPLLPNLQQHYKITKLGLFGSYSRNQATEDSDIDLLIQLDPDITFGLITLCHLENTLSDTLGKKVDLVIEDDLKPSLRQTILNDVIYL